MCSGKIQWYIWGETIRQRVERMFEWIPSLADISHNETTSINKFACALHLIFYHAHFVFFFMRALATYGICILYENCIRSKITMQQLFFVFVFVFTRLFSFSTVIDLVNRYRDCKKLCFEKKQSLYVKFIYLLQFVLNYRSHLRYVKLYLHLCEKVPKGGSLNLQMNQILFFGRSKIDCCSISPFDPEI